MMKTLTTLKTAAIVAVLSAVAAPAMAHHNVNGAYFSEKTSTGSGVLLEVKDIAPHAHWIFGVTGPNGQVQKWDFETVGNAALRRLGVKIKDEFKVGDTYAYSYSPSRDGSNTGFLTSITINGRTLKIVQL